jgi:gamma-glutamyltranspeptidase/glutathione hydrolase
MASVAAGEPAGRKPERAQRLADVPATSHMVAADADGNVANLTSTIEAPFGSGLVAGGILLNNEMTDFDLDPVRDGRPALNRMQPMKRPRSSMAPTLVYAADGQLLAAFGAAGGATIIAQVAKSIIAFVDWKQPVEEAIAAPQIMADRRGLRYERDTRLEAMAGGLKAMGHLNVGPATLPLKLNAVQRDGAAWRAAADLRSEGDASAIDAPGREAKKASERRR